MSKDKNHRLIEDRGMDRTCVTDMNALKKIEECQEKSLDYLDTTDCDLYLELLERNIRE
jgi:hypothetical protein